MEDTKRKCYPMVDLSKFIFNKNIFSEVVVIGYNYSQTFFFLVFIFFLIKVQDSHYRTSKSQKSNYMNFFPYLKKKSNFFFPHDNSN